MIPEIIKKAAIWEVNRLRLTTKEEVEKLRDRALRAINDYKEAKKEMDAANVQRDEIKQWLTENNINYEA